MQQHESVSRDPVIGAPTTNYFRVAAGRGNWDIFPFCDGDERSTAVAYSGACARFRGQPYTVTAFREPRVRGPWSGAVRIVGKGGAMPPHLLE